MEFIKNNKGIVTIAGVVVVALVAVMGIYGYLNGLRNEGIRREAALVAQYQDNQNELSNYIVSFKESLGIAEQGADKIDQILLDAVKGRYDGAMEPGTGGEMFSAISEAYPDLTATTESYAKVQDLVVSGRAAYKNKQSLLLDKIRSYETWKESGFIQSSAINALGFPSDRMEVRIGERTLTGDAALNEMKSLVLVSDAVKSYETHTTEPLITPEG